jgi:uncharacterized membrane protein
MRNWAKPAAASLLGLGGCLVAYALSRLDVPHWAVLAILVLGLCCFVLAVYFLTVGAESTDMSEAVEAARARQDHILTRLHMEYLNSMPIEEVPPEIRRSPTPLLPKEWVENRLHEMGETWRRKEYRPPRQ